MMTAKFEALRVNNEGQYRLKFILYKKAAQDERYTVNILPKVNQAHDC
jgi:hypothetical protein